MRATRSADLVANLQILGMLKAFWFHCSENTVMGDSLGSIHW